MMLNILRCAGQPPTMKSYPVGSVRSAVLSLAWSIRLLLTDCPSLPQFHQVRGEINPNEISSKKA